MAKNVDTIPIEVCILTVDHDIKGTVHVSKYTNIDKILSLANGLFIRDTYFKYVNFPFARGTDGTKIIQTNNNRIPAIILYFFIKRAKLPNIGFARHFMYLKDYPVIIPDHEVCKKFVELVKEMTDNHKNNIEENYELFVAKDFLLPLLINRQVIAE